MEKIVKIGCTIEIKLALLIFSLPINMFELIPTNAFTTDKTQTAKMKGSSSKLVDFRMIKEIPPMRMDQR